MQNFYSNNKGQLDKLRKEIEDKDEIISKLSATLNKIANNLILKYPTVALSNNDLVPETAQSNENILPSAGDCSMQQIVKDEEDCAIIPASSTKINKKIIDYRQQKHQQLDFFLRKQQEVKFLMM